MLDASSAVGNGIRCARAEIFLQRSSSPFVDGAQPRRHGGVGLVPARGIATGDFKGLLSGGGRGYKQGPAGKACALFELDRLMPADSLFSVIKMRTKKNRRTRRRFVVSLTVDQ
ncbi:MAG: hypothetical protein WKG03_17335 [Telluria sp.]